MVLLGVLKLKVSKLSGKRGTEQRAVNKGSLPYLPNLPLVWLLGASQGVEVFLDQSLSRHFSAVLGMTVGVDLMWGLQDEGCKEQTDVWG